MNIRIKYSKYPLGQIHAWRLLHLNLRQNAIAKNWKQKWRADHEY